MSALVPTNYGTVHPIQGDLKAGVQLAGPVTLVAGNTTAATWASAGKDAPVSGVSSP